MYSKHEWATKNSRNLQTRCKMWREGYDYPADDEDEGRDYYEEADEQHDKHQDEKLDR